MMPYRYTMSSTGDSSLRFGDCDICEKHASETFHQIEERSYKMPSGAEGWTRYGCRSLFGHEACLKAARHRIDAPVLDAWVQMGMEEAKWMKEASGTGR